jgi:membrane-associated phospholipid phosphatase
VTPIDHHHWAGPENTPKAGELARFPLLSLAAAFLSIFLFAWLAESVAKAQTAQFDSYIRAAVHQWTPPALTRLMFAATWMGSAGLAIIALLAFALFRHFLWRRAAIWLLVTIGGATVLVIGLKFAFHRPRPVPFFGPVPQTYSFPSGHSLFSFCFYGVLAGLLADRVESRPLRMLIWIVAAALVLTIGLSRIYLGVHYPSDVLAGYLAGAIWVSTMLVLDRLRTRRKNSIS